MKFKDSITDYLGFLAVKITGFLVKMLPLRAVIFLGASLGGLFYHFDIKHRSIAYFNIKNVFGKDLTPQKIKRLTREFYRNFGRSIMDIFLLPRIDAKYLDKYIKIEGIEHIQEAFKKGKGIIILPVHEGSWEIANVVAANKFGVSYNVVIQDQKHPLLNGLLNSYRAQKGCKLISRRNETRSIIEALRRNEAVGMTLDQGGRSGTLVKFFGKEASFSSGAVRLALKYGSAIIPVFSYRVKGPHIKIVIEPELKLKKTNDTQKDILSNLQELVPVFEKLIFKNPKEYFWPYKIWKYSNEKNILILSDGKTGHLRQAQALAKITSAYLRDKGIKSNISTLEIEFKNKFSKRALVVSSCLSGKYHCQGCLWCLRKFLRKGIYDDLIRHNPDVVISCGSSIAPVNYIIARENSAKSLVIMRPSILGFKRFDLVVMPKHDNPPRRKNIAVINGALNLIDENYIQSCLSRSGIRFDSQGNKRLILGFLLGGDTKDFHLSVALVRQAIAQLKEATQKLDAQLMVTTSRRTAPAVEKIVKEEFKDYPRCRLLVIANENNPEFSVGAILGLSQILIVSPESISMVSEAVSSKKYVLVFRAAKLGKRHSLFLKRMAEEKHLYLAQIENLAEVIMKLEKSRPGISPLEDESVIAEKLGKIL